MLTNSDGETLGNDVMMGRGRTVHAVTVSHGPPEDVDGQTPASVDVEQLYRDYGRRVLGYALRRASSRDDALDVVAETFVIAWRKREHIPEEPDAHLPWLLTTARNCSHRLARDWRRADQVVTAVAREIDDPAIPDSAQIQQSRETNRELGAALAALHDDDRELVLLVSWDGLSPSAAGAVLGMQPNTARVRLHRARARLRRDLDERAANPQTTAAEHGPHPTRRVTP